MTELTDQQIVERKWLDVYEERARKALLMAERGWRDFAEQMRGIRESRSYVEAGYSGFEPYYNAVWRERAGKAIQTVQMMMRASVVESEVRSVRHDVVVPNDYRAISYLANIESPEEKARIIEESASSPGSFRANLVDRVREKTGVVEQLEEQGVVVPPYPDGPTPEQRAYDRVAQLKSVAADVQPENAARSIGSGAVAAAVLKDYEFLVPWVNRFVAELRMYAEETGSL